MILTRINMLFALFAICASPAHAMGLWTKTAEGLTVYEAQKTFVPDFFMIKTAIFAHTGAVNLAQTFTALMETCGKKYTSIGWVTHYLASGEKLSLTAAKRFAEDLNSKLDGLCLSEIQLDLEPLPSLPSWLPPFLKETKKYLNPSYALTVDIPAVSPKKLAGDSWTPSEAMSLLEVTDGVNLMIYDTGAATDEEYAKILEAALDFATSAVKSYPKKKIVLGLPAYKDGNAKLHNVDVESPTAFRPALRQMPKEKARILCDEKVRIAYYPDWVENNASLEDKDRTAAKDIEKWRIGVCASH